MDDLTADTTEAQVSEQVFAGIGSLQAFIDKARADGATGLFLHMHYFDSIEERIKELAGAYVSSLAQRQDIVYLRDMEEAEAEAIKRQTEGWA